MKKLLYLLVIAVTYTSISGCYKDNSTTPANSKHNVLARTSTSDPTMAPGLADEFNVDLTPTVVDQNTLGTWSGNFLNHVMYNTTAYAANQQQCVSAASLLAVFNGMSSTGHTTGKYFRGLRMIYGANAEGTIKLLFVPCYADSTGNDTASGKRIFNLTPGSTDLGDIPGPIYTVSSGQFTDITQDLSLMAEAKANVDRYRSYIKIAPKDSEGFRGKLDGTDANACFFPFQEIIALIEDNNATTIRFVSIAKITQPDNIYRHDLAMVPTTFSGSDGTGLFANMAADMSQMCPPVCNIVNYSRAVQ